MPIELAAAIGRELEGRSRQGLAERAAAISQTYRAGGTSARAIGGDDDALAYALVRMPATFAACAAAFTHTARRASGFAPRRLTDVGSGPGAASWAALEIWPGIEAVTQMDASAPFLTLSHRLAELGPTVLRGAEGLRADVAAKMELPAAELVTASYLLAEIAPAAQEGLVARLWAACEGLLVLVEPGTPAGFERLRAARIQLIAAGAEILAPCPGQAACPVQAPDWCHFSQRLPRAPDHRAAKQARLSYEDEKYAYVAAARPGVREGQAPGRVLSPPRRGKTGVALRLCLPEGIDPQVLVRRGDPKFAAARRLEWGDATNDGSAT